MSFGRRQRDRVWRDRAKVGRQLRALPPWVIVAATGVATGIKDRVNDTHNAEGT